MVSFVLTPLLALMNYRPFVSPLPVWNYWWVLLLPLCLAVSIVYKSIKCPSMKMVPRQALSITVLILLCMAGAAAVLSGLVRFLER
jgi:hypothetical protein